MGSRSNPGERCRLTGALFNPSVFSNFRECGDFFDINLFTDDGSLPAHKIILSACSDFFRDKLRLMQPSWTVGDPLFSSHQQPAPVMTAIYLTGISYANLESVLDFIYKGDVSIPVERLDDFLNTAHKLQVNGLLNDSPPTTWRDASLDPSTGIKATPIKEVSWKKKKATRVQTIPSPSKDLSKLKMEVHEQDITKDQEESVPTTETVIVRTVGDGDEMEVESTGQKTDEMTLEVVDVGYGVGGWRIEMADEQEDTAGSNDVLIDGKKVKHFIQKVDKTYQCQMCDHHSKDKSNLVRHLKRRHTQPTHELCPHCGKTYKNKECLYNHMSSKRCIRGPTFNPRDPRILSYLVFDDEEKKWSCNSCGNKYRQKVYAREHVVFKHLGEAGSSSPK